MKFGKMAILLKSGGIKEAGLFFGKEKPTSIVSCCKGRYHTAYGFKWKYLN